MLCLLYIYILYITLFSYYYWLKVVVMAVVELVAADIELVVDVTYWIASAVG